MSPPRPRFQYRCRKKDRGRTAEPAKNKVLPEKSNQKTTPAASGETPVREPPPIPPESFFDVVMPSTDGPPLQDPILIDVLRTPDPQDKVCGLSLGISELGPLNGMLGLNAVDSGVPEN